MLLPAHPLASSTIFVKVILHNCILLFLIVLATAGIAIVAIKASTTSTPINSAKVKPFFIFSHPNNILTNIFNFFNY